MRGARMTLRFFHSPGSVFHKRGSDFRRVVAQSAKTHYCYLNFGVKNKEGLFYSFHGISKSFIMICNDL
jgi:hypothetical protein